MAMAKASGVEVQKTVFVVENDMTTTGTGGNTLNFKNQYGGTQSGVYIYDIANNATTSGCAVCAYQNKRGTVAPAHEFIFERTNGATNVVASNYDLFLKAGAVITRWFIPVEAFV